MPRNATPEGSDLREKQRYVQGYLMVVSSLYGRKHFSAEQARIAERAWKQKLPPSGFVNLIRREDPAYPRTQDFAKRHEDARQVWVQKSGGRAMPHDFATNYVRSGLSRTQLLSRLEQGMSKKLTVPPPVTANAYRTMRSLLNDSFLRITGKEAHPRLHDLVFSGRLSDADVENEYLDLIGGKDAFRWLDEKEAPDLDQQLRRQFVPIDAGMQMPEMK
jgi:hypothetical protein